MNTLTVTPHLGIGSLQLGMSPEQIISAISQLINDLQLPTSGQIYIGKNTFSELTEIRYIDDSFFFLVTYRNNQAIEICVNNELRNHLPIMLYDIDFFRTPAEEIINSLKKLSPFTYDLEDEQLSTTYEFNKLGLRLWREDAFHPKLLHDPIYMKEMELVIEDMYQYEYFQLIGVQYVQ